MPTTKKRLNISLTDELAELVKLLANRDSVPQATKVVELLKKAIEEDEDEILAMMAEERIHERKTKKLDLISFDDAFGS